MFSSGQNNFTGISAQADITLFYLLNYYKREDFQRIIIEGKNYDDFCIVFNTYNLRVEVKWFSRALTYSDIKKIIYKELKKEYSKNDIFKIIARNISEIFKNDFYYLKDSWLTLFFNQDEKDELYNDPVIKKLLRKKWNLNEIRFLLDVELEELKNVENVSNKIFEFFIREEPFYLNETKIESIIGSTFRKILLIGSKGKSISKKQFETSFINFKNDIVDMSESFSPEFSIKHRVYNLDNFLVSEKKFKKLNYDKYLSPISDDRRLIIYIYDELEKNDYEYKSFKFFVDKILIKNTYMWLTLHLIKKKWSQRKINPENLLDFITNHYDKLIWDFNYEDALKLLIELSQEDQYGKYDERIFEFIKENILIKSGKGQKLGEKKGRKEFQEKELISKWLKIFYSRTKNKPEFIKFLFEYFDFTGDDTELIVETHYIIYGILKKYIKIDINKNFKYVLKKICDQFDKKYSNEYKGYEWVGFGISQSGNEYTIEDIGIVRCLFSPFFEDFYKIDKKNAWRFIKTKIMKNCQNAPEKYNPVFLYRALINLLINRFFEEGLKRQDKLENINFLKKILIINNGIPKTETMLFYKLKDKNLEKIGFNKVFDFIKLDSKKYLRKGNEIPFPSNIFVIFTLIELIKIDYKPAKLFFIKMIKTDKFYRNLNDYDPISLLASSGIYELDYNFMLNVFRNIDMKQYLGDDKDYRVWSKSVVLSNMLKAGLKKGRNESVETIHSLLKPKKLDKATLQFLSSVISDLKEEFAIELYEILKDYFKNKNILRNKFKACTNIRIQFVWLIEKLILNGKYDEAKNIVELFIDDPDPITSNEEKEFNYHLQVKLGTNSNIITTVRGTLSWILRLFINTNNPELMKYALDKTEILLDLNGELAKKLNYNEPDYYVRLMAIFPLLRLSEPRNIQVLNEFETDLRLRIKFLIFKLYNITKDDCYNLKINPRSILEKLVALIYQVIEIKEDEAKEITEFFENYRVEEAYILFIYYAEYNKGRSGEIKFDSTYFKKKLSMLCKYNNIFKKRITNEFWRFSGQNDKFNFNKIEKYWIHLIEEYDQDVFYSFRETLENTLKWDEKFEKHVLLFKKLIKKETDYYKEKQETIQLRGMHRELFEIIFQKNMKRYFEIFFHLLKCLNENIHYYSMVELIKFYKSIKKIPSEYNSIYKKIYTRLEELYPHILKN